MGIVVTDSLSSNYQSRFFELLELLKQNGLKQEEISIVERAFFFAEKAHQGQKRASGEDFIVHPLEVAYLLAELRMDAVTIVSGLLHDLLEDTSVPAEEVVREFGDTVYNIINGVTAISRHQMRASLEDNENLRKLINLRKLLVASVDDVRVLLVKFADRLHNMRTISYLKEENQRRIANETLNIYAPLAHRLGIYRWKMELEDLSFAVLLPVEYQCLKRRIAKTENEREQEIKQIMSEMQERLQKIGISARILGRPKHLYSIYRKMKRQQIPLEKVMDLYAVRVIVQTVEDCYRVLDIAHGFGNIIPDRFRDNIKKPRSNGYRSLHTTVFIPNKYPLEIQIRTEEMDYEAEYGIAAHWRYKEGNISEDEAFHKRLDWLRDTVKLLTTSTDSNVVLTDIQDELRDSDIAVFTPKGDVIELPVNATVLDFAYSIHTEIGHHCTGAMVNGRWVPIYTRLKNGDLVEVQTSPKQEPRLDWLNVVVLGKVRNKIRHYLREKGVLPKEKQLVEQVENKRDVEDKLGLSEASSQLFNLPVFDLSKLDSEELDKERRLSIYVDGHKNISVRFARCCNPVQGDAVVGYSTLKGIITIHKVDCKIFNGMEKDPTRLHKVFWDREGVYDVVVQVFMRPSKIIFQELTALIWDHKLPFQSARMKKVRAGMIRVDITFRVVSPYFEKAIEGFMRTIRMITGVVRVQKKNL